MEADQKFDKGIEWLFAVCRYELRSLSAGDKDCLRTALKSLGHEWRTDGFRDAHKPSWIESDKVKGRTAEQKAFKGVKK